MTINPESAAIAALTAPETVLSDSEGEWVIKADTGVPSSEEDSSDDELDAQYSEQQKFNHNDDDVETFQPSGVLAPSTPSVNLNQLKSQILRLKLQGKTEEAAALQVQYDAEESGSNVKVLDSVEIRQTQLLDTHKTAPEDMTIADMIREEKLTAESGRSNRADREWANVLVAASASGNAEDDNDELFDAAANVGRGPRRTHENQKTEKDKALERTRAHNLLADRCPLCLDSTAAVETPGSKPQPISIASRAYLAPAPTPALVPHTMAIIPLAHEARNLTALDADDWEEIRNYMKCLIRYWSAESRGRTSVVFYENAVFSQGARSHPALFAVPVPTDLLESSVIPGAFRAAFESADEEWSTHRKVIDSSRVPGGFRATFAKEAPYFHVWFTINGGLGHIVEGDQWPRHDLFAREVLGGVLGTDIAVIKRRTRWTNVVDTEFEKKFAKYDWVDQVQQY
ncbi:hypothetical protein D0Z03_000526 [Geotrichum reessii]|nr:hypothetical protein D0Z03_000526 [Galactomyces reessii]